MKKLSFIQRSADYHWVGDGFPVRGVFSYNDIAEEMSPFLLLDYAGPTDFPATNRKLGVGEHPHRGFETVTIVYDGEVSHRDSSGGGGTIGPGDVQWMTAGSGVVHEEFHGENYAKRGGPFEMIQLWVNLPQKDKMTKPGYQGVTKEQIPNVLLPNEAGKVRVIAGEYLTKKGPARTYSSMQVWDVRMNAGGKFDIPISDGDSTSFFVLRGRIRLASGEFVGETELAVFDREGDKLSIEAMDNTTLLFLSGKPLNEPIVGYGPFVMNSGAEIQQAFSDYRSGRMGKL